MKIRFFLLFFLLIIISYSCVSPTKVILLEERDPIVKTLHEKDSMVIYRRDTLKTKN